MQLNERQVLDWIGLSEGGYVNHLRDPGGATDRGITQATYDAWNRSKGRPVKPVRGIGKDEAEDILVAQYLLPVRFDDLPSGLDYAVADWSVNSGPARAVKELQLLLGVAADGIVGARTLDAIKARHLEDLIVAYSERRMRFLRGLKTWRDFGNGWTARVMGQRDGFQTNDIGVIDRAVMLSRAAAVIPAPTVAAPAKADERDEKQTSILQRVFSDPVALLPAAGAFLTPLVDGSGPIQWAIAAAIMVGVAWALMRAVKQRAV